MLHKEPGKRKKLKPRGRPFTKGNKRGKSQNEILDSSGFESGIEGGTLDKVEPPEMGLSEGSFDGVFFQISHSAKESIDKVLKDCMEKNEDSHIEEVKEQSEKEGAKKETKELETIESIDFKRGENVLSIRFSKRHNRMYRIQIFLNNDLEIRPVTYTGASTGNAFWNLLKGALKSME